MATIELRSGLGKKFKVFVFRDGSLKFESQEAGAAYEYDASMLEFGEELTELSYFVRTWGKNTHLQIEALTMFCFNYDQAILLSIDAILHITEVFVRDGLSASTAAWIDSEFARIIDLVRHGVRHGFSEAELRGTENDVRRMKEYIPLEYAGVHEAIAALLQLVFLSEGKLEGFYGSKNIALICLLHAARAEAYMRSSVGTKEWMDGQASEQSWQLRRAVDVLDALQVGKIWPPLNATE